MDKALVRNALQGVIRATDDDSTPIIRRLARVQARAALETLDAEAASGAGEREDKVERCWECSCGWKGCYTAEQIAEHGEPAECNRCCRERLEEVETATSSASLPPATDPAIPDGWKLVPVEPTGEMAAAGVAAINDTDLDGPSVWSAMVAAAPTIPATGHAATEGEG